MLCHLKYKCDFLLNIHTNIVPGNNAGNRINSYMKICVIRIDHVSIIVLGFNELKQEPCVCTVEGTQCAIIYVIAAISEIARVKQGNAGIIFQRSEEHTSALQ